MNGSLESRKEGVGSKNESQERGREMDVAGEVVNESVRRLRLRPADVSVL
jgi:hypothetical protein